MKSMQSNSVDLTLTDIPYGEVSRKDNGLNNLNKGLADVVTFDINEFLNEVYRITKSTIIIFCGRGQLSDISKFFDEKQKQSKGTPR
jgi:DNA modification methylase